MSYLDNHSHHIFSPRVDCPNNSLFARFLWTLLDPRGQPSYPEFWCKSFNLFPPSVITYAGHCHWPCGYWRSGVCIREEQSLFVKIFFHIMIWLEFSFLIRVLMNIVLTFFAGFYFLYRVSHKSIPEVCWHWASVEALPCKRSFGLCGWDVCNSS